MREGRGVGCANGVEHLAKLRQVAADVRQELVCQVRPREEIKLLCGKVEGVVKALGQQVDVGKPKGFFAF